MRTAADRSAALDSWATDDLLQGYVSWREECQAVWQADERWIVSARGDRGLAHAAYLAALDREEQAACTYAHHVERVRGISR